MQTDSKNSTDKLAAFENLVKLTPIFTASILAISITYDYAYLWALDLSLSDIPSSISEHIRSALLWSPIALALSMGIGVINSFSNQFDTISTKSANFVKKIAIIRKIESKNPNFLLYSGIAISIVAMLIANILTQKIEFLFFAIGYIWVCVILKYIYELEKNKIKPIKIIVLLYFFPILLFCVGAFGFHFGGKLLRSNTPKWEYTIKKNDNDIPLKVYGQRRFTEFTIAVTESRKILIISNNFIVSTKSL